MVPPNASTLEALLAYGEDLGQLGFWTLDLRSGEVEWSEGMCRIFGITGGEAPRDEAGATALFHKDDRPAVAAALQEVARDPLAAAEGRELADLRALRPDGSIRHVRSRGRVELDEEGTPVRWVGAAQDITDLHWNQYELRVHYALAETLADWESFDEGVMALLGRVGAALEYEMAALWLCLDGDRRLACRAFWSEPDVSPGDFEFAVRKLRFEPGEGGPGVAWQSQAPVVIADTATDSVFRPRDAAVERGVCSALVFPALGPGGPMAVLSFYALRQRVPGPNLVRALSVVGKALGEFLARRQPELGSSPLTERELDVLRLAAAGNKGREIADQLYVSPETVKSHFEHIYDKLGVSDRAAAVAYALRAGLIE